MLCTKACLVKSKLYLLQHVSDPEQNRSASPRYHLVVQMVLWHDSLFGLGNRLLSAKGLSPCLIGLKDCPLIIFTAAKLYAAANCLRYFLIRVQ